ncbi:MAG: fibronectin type III domain-containing protein, partial [Actinomycetota bacterium]
MKIRRKAAILAAMAIAMSVIWHAPAAPSLFTSVEGFATKTGFRGVFAWQASQPVKAVVHYGVDPQALDASTVALPGAPDAAGMTIIDGLEAGATYYWQVEDLVTGEKSEVSNFKAANAYNDWDGQTYTLDLLIQLDSESLPPGVPWDLASENTAAGVNIFAERLYDAMDGFARLGNVIITDTETDNAGSVPFVPGTGCAAVEGAGGNLADVLIQTTLPFDSHTFSGWAIDEPCTSFYVGRIGQLVSPWGEIGPEDLHFGFVATHEMMHYAFNAPDLYGASDINDPRSSGCWDLSWDGSLMHNSGGWNGKRWELTELDRNPHLTPCDH